MHHNSCVVQYTSHFIQCIHHTTCGVQITAYEGRKAHNMEACGERDGRGAHCILGPQPDASMQGWQQILDLGTQAQYEGSSL